MSFIKFLWRDIKADYSFNWFYVLCASLGIVGLLIVESFRGGVQDKVARNAKNFIASDLAISSRRSFTEEEIKKIETYLDEKDFAHAKWIETYSLVSKAGEGAPLSKLANLNFVSPLFPFYGGALLDQEGYKTSGEWKALHEEPILWLSRDLAWELQVKIGESLKIGEKSFTIKGIVERDDFSSFRGFSLAPKIFLSHNFLKETDLVKFGSTATTSYILKLPDTVPYKKVQRELRDLIPDSAVRINGPEESNQQISRSLNILTDYLSLITLMTYLLSLVGLYYFTQHFLSRQLKTFSIYKAMGIKTSFLFKISFVQLFLLAILSLFISSLVVALGLPFLEKAFFTLVGDQLSFSLSSRTLLKIFGLSLGGSLLALGPLFWGALQVPVATVFQDLPTELKRIKFYYFIPLLLYVVVLAIFLAHSVKVGAYFLGGLGAIIILSSLFFKAMIKTLDTFSSRFKFASKHAAKTLGRHFTSSFTIFMCLLIGMTLTAFVLQLETSLQREFSDAHKDKRPDLFMFDLQDEQVQKFKDMVSMEKWNQTMFAPMVRARLVKVNGESIQKREEAEESSFNDREESSANARKNRGVNLSYRPTLSWAETLVEGHFSQEKCNPSLKPCEISLERSYARRMNLKLGDKLVYDVSGVEVEGVVSSFRTVKWTSFEPNFFILFQPGVLEEAPKTYLASIKVKSLEEKRAVFAKIAEGFPGVSLLEVSEVVRKITLVLGLMAIAIKCISFLSLFVALVVLVAVSFNHLGLRKREMALFHMMGLKQMLIKSIYIREFSFLILACILLSLLFGSGLSYTIMNFVFNSQAFFRLPLLAPVMVILGGGLLVIVSFRVKSLVQNKSLF